MLFIPNEVSSEGEVMIGGLLCPEGKLEAMILFIPNQVSSEGGVMICGRLCPSTP